MVVQFRVMGFVRLDAINMVMALFFSVQAKLLGDIRNGGEETHLYCKEPLFGSYNHTAVRCPDVTKSNSKSVAVVTGSGQGIGRSIAMRLAEDRYDVAINDLESNKENLDAVRKEIMLEIDKRR
jgi:hypothetical protein